MTTAMRIDIEHMRGEFERVQQGKRSRHSVADRVRPSRWQYDYLTLSTLSRDIHALVSQLPLASAGTALDLGCDKSPYRELLTSRGYGVKTLDITRATTAPTTPARRSRPGFPTRASTSCCARRCSSTA
jgi:hypothetical protein